MKTLPKYYAIRRDENNPLWDEYIKWLNETHNSNVDGKATMFPFYGFGGVYKRYSDLYQSIPEKFDNPVTVITLEQWAEATRGNVKSEPEVNTLDFDPSKPFEVTFGGGKWKSTSNCGILREIRKYHFVGFSETGRPVVEHGGGFDAALGIRNVQPFTAAMLEVGEYMETEEGPDGKRNLIKCISDSPWTYHDVRNKSGLFYCDIANDLKGRRVGVDLIVREV